MSRFFQQEDLIRLFQKIADCFTKEIS